MAAFTAPAANLPLLKLDPADPELLEELLEVVARVASTGAFTMGTELEAFEEEFAAYCETDHAIGVSSGTEAIVLALRALGIGAGDEVIVPANSFIATAEAVSLAGATPRLVDVDPLTHLITPEAAQAAIGARTRCVIPVHLMGSTVDMTPLLDVARAAGLAVIEDCAQAHGATWDGHRAGSVGRAAAFSFYPTKNLGALGDGGAVVSDDAELVGRIRRLADHGRSSTDRYAHDVSGRNSRLDTLQAAALHVKLAVLDRANRSRSQLVERYRQGVPSWCDPVAVDPAAEPVYHLAVVQVPDRATVTRALDAAGVGWGLHYPVPCHLQPAFASFADGPLPFAEAAADRILSLPLSPTMQPDQVDRVCEVLANVEL
jgi:dTDP-4-amino-4,6-dideoxygalactose transaminase